MTMDIYGLVLGILAVWRVTHLLGYEHGPFGLFSSFRNLAGEESSLGRTLNCFYCLSLWIALPFAFFIGQNLLEAILLWLACSGGAILLERITLGESSQPVPAETRRDVKTTYPKPLLTPIYWEEQGDRS